MFQVVPRLKFAAGGIVSPLIVVLLALTVTPCPAADADLPVIARKPSEPRETRFMRVTRDADDNPLAMQTAIKRYIPADGSRTTPVVDLIAAVHIADGRYFQQLNKEFAGYDALLYELVAPKGVVPKRGRNRSTGMVSGLQNMLKDMLELEFQLAEIDYERKNFVHADMSPEQFSRSMRDRGESPIQMFFRMLRASAAAQAQRKRPPVSDALVLRALFDTKRRASILKRIMADELSEADAMLDALNGEQGTTLITGRNAVALKVLGEQIRSGKRRIGIYYGSGHMPDMEQRLIDDFGLKWSSTRWLTAWDLKPSDE